jgi:muramidase (phage lysozyme)
MSPSLKAFLDMIAHSEGTSLSPITKNGGYDVIVSGPSGPEVFSDYSDHPFAAGRPAKVVRSVPLLTSTASGRYQLLLRYWRAYQPMLHLPDFSPASQDAVALQQIKERGGLIMILEGDIQGAIKACSNIWASLPGAEYGQPTRNMDELLSVYQNSLASTVEQA